MKWFARRRGVLPPQPSQVDFGDFLSPDPVSAVFGFDRGTPIDRYYIDRFFAHHTDDVRGVCLEVADNTYTTTWGKEQVEKSDILHATGAEGACTIVGDLTHLDAVADNTYDCIILTQVLQFICDMPRAVREIYRILKPGGVCLATFTCISQISRYDMDRWGEYWRVTDLGARRLFETSFSPTDLVIATYGNACSATAFLQGIATEELTSLALDATHPDYQVLIAVRAQKPGGRSI